MSEQVLPIYKRLLQKPSKSFFLFGPRATGKTSWLRENFADAITIDLLDSRQFLQYTANPSLIEKVVPKNVTDRWVVIDEIQKVPALLDEIQRILLKSKQAQKFVLTGSSARKLKRSGSNLLGGRAVTRSFFTLNSGELGADFDVDKAMRFGTLPLVYTQSNSLDSIDYLEGYVNTYLKEEIQQEAVVKKLDAFARFLEVMGILNGQILNVSNVANDAKVARTTINGYVEILIDTLVGYLLPAWRPAAKVKEVEHPKFYFFDPGVVRVLSGTVRDTLGNEEKGRLFETLVLNELRSYVSYNNLGGSFSYWRTADGNEIDVVWCRGKKRIGFEIKATHSWRTKFSATIRDMISSGHLSSGYGIYLGDHELKEGAVSVISINSLGGRLKEIFF